MVGLFRTVADGVCVVCRDPKRLFAPTVGGNRLRRADEPTSAAIVRERIVVVLGVGETADTGVPWSSRDPLGETDA